MVILVVFNSFNVVQNLKKPDPVAHQMPPFSTTTHYLLYSLSLNKFLIKHTQFLQHEKNNARSTSTVSNLGAAVTKVCHFNYTKSEMLFQARKTHYLLLILYSFFTRGLG